MDASETSALSVAPPFFPWTDFPTPTQLATGTTTIIFRSSIHGLPVALKTLAPSSLPSAAADLQAEARINAYLRHPNIVQFLGLASPPTPPAPPALVFELADGALDCAAFGPTRAPAAACALLDVARALAFAHALRVLHRDVKPSQVLRFGARYKLGDWGLARACAAEGEQMSGETGTWEFMAPEVIRCEAYDASADVFSFGMLAWCVAHGSEYPYAEAFLTAAQAAVGVGKGSLRPRLSGRVSGSLRVVMEACWAQEAADRPDMGRVVEMLEGVVSEKKEAKGTGAWAWVWG